MGRENFSKRTGIIREDYSDDDDYLGTDDDDSSEVVKDRDYMDARRRHAARRRESTRTRSRERRPKAESKESEFETQLNKCKDKCTGKVLQVFNILAYGLLVLTTLIRFAYLAQGFSFFYLV